MLTLYIESDNVLEIQSLVNAIDDSVVTDAVVTATIRDRSGDVVAGESFPVTLAHVSAGTYRKVLAETLELKKHRRYWVTVEAISPTIGKKVWKDVVEAEYEVAP